MVSILYSEHIMILMAYHRSSEPGKTQDNDNDNDNDEEDDDDDDDDDNCTAYSAMNCDAQCAACIAMQTSDLTRLMMVESCPL